MHTKKLSDLNRIVNISTEIRRKPQNHKDWTGIALEALENQKLEAIIGTEEARKMFGIKMENFIDFPIDPFEYKINSLQPVHTSVVPKNKIGLRDALKPILQYAKIIRIIDPYFNCLAENRGQAYFNALKLIAELVSADSDNYMANRMHRKVIEIFTSKDKSGLPKSHNVLKDKYNEKLLNVATTYGLKIEMHILRSIPGGTSRPNTRDRPHDRFLLTDQFGFSLSQGIMFNDESDMRPVVLHLLTEDSWRVKMEECTVNPHYETDVSLFVEPSTSE